jgi:glycosyltransferase involved in cell wall biosynthesis
VSVRASIVITSYNYARYLDAAVQSALSQSHPQSELIIVDDGSTDETESILRRYERQALVVRQARAGQCAAYNAGLERARGEVVIFLDADDTLAPHALARIIPLFTQQVVKVQFRLNLIDTWGRPRGGVIPRQMQQGDLSALVRAGRLCHSAPGTGNAYRVSDLRRLAPFPVSDEDRYGADFFAINGSALLGRVRSCDEALGAYRVHADGHDGTRFFGNAASWQDEHARTQSRHERLRTWVRARLGPDCIVAPCQPAFSLEKHVFAKKVLEAPGYSAGLRGGLRHFVFKLWPAIRLHSERPTLRLGLCMWALGVAALPRLLARPLARLGVDPSSRRGVLDVLHKLVD